MRTHLQASARGRLRTLAVACGLAMAAATIGASAQNRASLSDRVSALEARIQQNQSEQSVEQLNRIAQLEADVKALRALVEQLQNENQQAQDRAKAQYIDLDGRLGKLESAAAAPPPAPVKPPAPTGRVPAAKAPAVLPSKQSPAAATPPPVAPAAGGDTAPPVTDKAAYDNAFAAMKAEHFADSANQFKAFVQQYPDSSLAPNAWYWMGESYYVTQNYQPALDAFKAVLDHYPDSPKTPGALLKIGYCQDGLKQRDAAQATLREVIQKYPNSEEATQAESRLRAMSMDAGG